ncbi:hypothetical protein ZIOFF_021291 [Zingiber officinale]|uniref:ATP-dependent Clp protease proteolytic subunit n=1 Tax=Zingiber officinale TaxID=94328 RepID=A0A8J5LGC6_ZINOF|nr:hypothetical protein ZIOFF_021291 [Zingiber officinale]
MYVRYSAKKGSRGRVFMMPIGIPRVPYRTPGEGTWQWVDLWNALYRERVVFIGEHIDEEYSNQVLATMLYLDSIESSKKIYLYINGPGGDLTPSMSIYDTMQSLQSPVATHCVGYAYDMAAYILAAGEKGNRSGMPLCEIALQTPAGVARGQMRFLIISLPPLKMIGILISLFQQSLYLQLLSDMWKRHVEKADDVQNEANELLRIRDYLFSELSKKTGQPLERISKDLVYVARFTAQEALEYGLIDCIIRPSRIKPDAPRKETPGIGRG